MLGPPPRDAGAATREYLTAGFGADSPAWLDAVAAAAEGEAGAEGLAPEAFAAALRALLAPPLAARFSGVEAVPHPRQQTVSVVPRGGSLVLFDSVAVPHRVLPTAAGERIALAGWLHEEQQACPEWFG